MIARCVHTDLTVPECSCRACTVALVDRHAPQLRRAVIVPLRRPGTRTGERPATGDVRTFGGVPDSPWPVRMIREG